MARKGAGGNLKTPQLIKIANFFANKGFTVLRFTCKGLNIKYRVKIFKEVIKFVLEKYKPDRIIIGGRSMGARAAVMTCLDSEITQDSQLTNKLSGVICLSYPLHKENDSVNLRDTILLESTKPIFFLSGTKDKMCKRTIFENLLQKLKSPYKVHWLRDCDHSAMPKDTNEMIYSEALEELVVWCNSITS